MATPGPITVWAADARLQRPICAPAPMTKSGPKRTAPSAARFGRDRHSTVTTAAVQPPRRRRRSRPAGRGDEAAQTGRTSRTAALGVMKQAAAGVDERVSKWRRSQKVPVTARRALAPPRLDRPAPRLLAVNEFRPRKGAKILAQRILGPRSSKKRGSGMEIGRRPRHRELKPISWSAPDRPELSAIGRRAPAPAQPGQDVRDRRRLGDLARLSARGTTCGVRCHRRVGRVTRVALEQN